MFNPASDEHFNWKILLKRFEAMIFTRRGNLGRESIPREEKSPPVSIFTLVTKSYRGKYLHIFQNVLIDFTASSVLNSY